MSSDLKSAIQKYEAIEQNFIDQIENKYKLKFDKTGIFASTLNFSGDQSPFINFKSSACVACRTGINTNYQDRKSVV